jgi:tripartite-type tricarboxylate transporter receptor subunit TctC
MVWGRWMLAGVRSLGAPIAAAGLLMIALGASAGQGAEADVSAFYAGKQIRLIVGYPPGGGYDAYGRLLARHFGAHIPGNPKLVPVNMPGAGSIILANYLFNRAPRDGTVLGVVAGDTALNPLFNHPEAHYDSLKMSWVGSMNEETSTCFAWHTAPIRSIEDVFQHEFLVGTSSSTGTTFSYPTSSNYLLGTKFRIIPGYAGTNDTMLAVERGEVQGMCGTAWNSIRTERPEWLSDHLIRMILQEAVTRNPDLPDVPTVMDLAKTDQQKQVLQTIYGWQLMRRPVVGPPDIPRDRLDALRRAFDATMVDPAFLADARQTMLDVRALRADQIEAFLAGVQQTPKAIVEEAATALRRNR